MNGERIFLGNTIEDVAENFAKIVSDNYLEHLEHWAATATDNPREYCKWQLRIKDEPGVVREKVYHKLLKIMLADKKENKQFFLKRCLFFRSKSIIVINRKSDFYNDLIPKRAVRNSNAANVEYRINKKEFYIEKIIYPHAK